MMNPTTVPSREEQQDALRLADFVMLTQRSCVLNLSRTLSDRKLSFPQFFLLTYLESEDFLTMSSIAKKMGHSTAAATGLVDRLQKLEYVTRGHANEDRRKILVRITEHGQAIVNQLRNELAGEIATLMAGCEEEDHSTLRAGHRASQAAIGR